MENISQSNKNPAGSEGRVPPIETVENFIPLTPEQEILVQEGLAHVYKIAHKMFDGSHYFEVGDFISFGTIGLIDAARGFDGSVKFETYASHRIRGAILDGMRSVDILSRDHRKFLKKVEKAKKKLRDTLMRDPVEEELANELGLSVSSFREKNIQFGIVIETLPVNDEGNSMLGNISSDNVNIETKLVKEEMEHALKEAMASLNETDRQMIFLFFLGEKNLKNKDIAKILNLDVTPGRISQMRRTALNKLKILLETKKI